MITTSIPESWKDLQNEVGRILDQCGFESQVEKKVTTVRGTVELDVYAEEIVKGRKYSIVCECKHWKSNIPQAIIHGFRTVITDLGANIGYLITTSEFQSGARSASDLTNVELLTWHDFQNIFFESWFENYFSPKITEKLDPILTYSEPLFPKWFDKMSDTDKETYRRLKDKYDLFGWLIMSFTPYVKMIGDYTIPTLPLIDRVHNSAEVLSKIPMNILEEKGYDEFLNLCIEYGQIAIAKFRVLRDKYMAK